MLTTTRPQPATPVLRPVSFRHRPGLDGLRGLAVAGVLLFHAGLPWAVGGYLGVSAFFTLSGFLITTLLLTEHTRSGAVDLAAFWIRRVRRLLPAALLGIAAGVAYVLVFGDATAIDRVRADALSAIGYVANWRFVLSDQSYAELFTGDSPLQHLWSLAIEEQFYVVLPLAAVVAFRRGDPARRLATFAAVGLVASVGTTFLLGSADVDRLYYGTDTRAAELLVGVLLACLHHRRDVGERFGARRDAFGAAALVGMGVLWVVADQSWSSLHPWVLLVHAVLTAAVVVAAIGEGDVARGLSARPLVALGRISYGVYLFHWPIYLWLDEQRTGLDDLPLLALRVAVTLAVSVASYRLVESPIRYGTRLRAPREAAGTALALGLAVILVAVSTTVVHRDPLIDFAAVEETVESLDEPEVATMTPTEPVTASGADDPAALPPTPRVAVFGDSTALLFVPGLLSWAEQTGDIRVVKGAAALGCGVGRGGERANFEEVFIPVPESCDFDTSWQQWLLRNRPDIALIEVGIWDIVERRLPGDDVVRTIGDPRYDAYLEDELRAATELVLETADRVVWVLQPPPVRSTRDADDPVFDRLPLFNDMLVDLFEDEPEVGLVDVAGWLSQHPEGTDSLRLRPDGTHFSEETSVELADWLAPALLEAATRGGVIRPGDVTPDTVEP